MVQPNGSTDKAIAWKNFRFILSEIRLPYGWQLIYSSPGFAYPYIVITFCRLDTATKVYEPVYWFNEEMAPSD